MALKALTRELQVGERRQLLAHLLALSPDDRRLRFEHAMSDDGMRHCVDGIDFLRDAVFVVTGGNLAVVGAAHLARSEGHAELGVSVLPPERGQGIGGVLLERSAARARNWGIRVMFMNCLVENAPMMHLARKQNLNIVVSGSEAEAFVRLPRADLGRSGHRGRVGTSGLVRLRPEDPLAGAPIAAPVMNAYPGEAKGTLTLKSRNGARGVLYDDNRKAS